MAKRPTKKAKSEAASKLAEALNFVSPVSIEGEEPYKAHARVAGKMITATNGVFTAGHAIEEEFALCPHVGRFVDALNRAGTTLALTENENGTLLVKGDKIRATVPCLPGDKLPQIMPDPRIATIDDRLKEGFAKLLPLIDNEGDRVIEVSIMVQANSMFATNGYILYEYWHGIDLPPGLVVPKPFAKAIVGANKKLEGFGFSAKSITVYFDDGSWYKSQQYEEKWPNVEHLFDFPSFPSPVPEGLFEAISAIESFSKDGIVHFHEDKLKSTYDAYQDRGSAIYGATYDVPGLQAGHSFTAKLLRTIEPVCASLDYTSNADRAFFTDNANVRGSIMKVGMKANEPKPDRTVETAWTMPETAAGGAVARDLEETAATASGNGWGVPSAPSPETGAFDPWAAIVNPLGIEEDDIPF